MWDQGEVVELVGEIQVTGGAEHPPWLLYAASGGTEAEARAALQAAPTVWLMGPGAEAGALGLGPHWQWAEAAQVCLAAQAQAPTGAAGPVAVRCQAKPAQVLQPRPVAADEGDGGGCSAAPDGPAPPLAWLWLGVALAWRRRG